MTTVANLPDKLTARISAALALLDAVEAIEASRHGHDSDDDAIITYHRASPGFAAAWTASASGSGLVDAPTLAASIVALAGALK